MRADDYIVGVGDLGLRLPTSMSPKASSRWSSRLLAVAHRVHPSMRTKLYATTLRPRPSGERAAKGKKCVGTRAAAPSKQPVRAGVAAICPGSGVACAGMGVVCAGMGEACGRKKPIIAGMSVG